MKILIEKKAIIKGKIKKEQKTEIFDHRDEEEWISQSSTISPSTQPISHLKKYSLIKIQKPKNLYLQINLFFLLEEW